MAGTTEFRAGRQVTARVNGGATGTELVIVSSRRSNAAELRARAIATRDPRQPRTQRGALVDVPARSKSLTFALAELVEQRVHVADRLEAEVLEDRTRHRAALRYQRRCSPGHGLVPTRAQERAVRTAAPGTRERCATVEEEAVRRRGTRSCPDDLAVEPDRVHDARRFTPALWEQRARLGDLILRRLESLPLHR